MAEQDPIKLEEPPEQEELEGFDPEDLIGDTLAGRYEVERRIGKGGMGVVYLASQSALNRKVVVKVLGKNIGDEDEAIQRFEREALGLSQLQHPNIVTIYDFGRDRDLAYIVMEYVEGETLSQLLRRDSQLAFDEFAGIATQILDALSEAHGRGIIHRDIKPSNIMLCERHGHANFVKVLDFGLAKLVHDGAEVTKKQNLVGSVAFLAPEQILGLDFDQRVDVYALGVLFYYMLSGQKPFRGEDDISVLYQHIHKDPTPLADLLAPGHDIPDEVIDLIHLCLSKDPKERPNTARELLNRFQTDLSRSVFQVPWASGEFTPSAVTAMPPQTPITPPGSGPVPMPTTHQTPHSGVMSFPVGDGSGQYQQLSQASMSHMSGVYAIPQEPRSKVIPVLLALGVLLAVGLGLGAIFMASQKGGEDSAVERARLEKVLGEVDALAEEHRWGQAESMLDSVRQDVNAHPELLRRHAEVTDRIVIGKHLEQAERAEKEGAVGKARALYEKVLERDPSHEHATARLAALPDASGAAANEAAVSTIKLDAPVEARVFIDGEDVGPTPVSHELAPGEHEIEVRAAGYSTWSKSLTLAAGETAVLDASLEKKAGGRVAKHNRKKSTGASPKKTSGSKAADKPPAGDASPKTEEPKPAASDDGKKKDGLLFPVGSGSKKDKKKKGPSGLLPVGN